MMLDKINTDKPVLEPQLTELLPYLDKTILINETFYPQLVSDLKKAWCEKSSQLTTARKRLMNCLH